MKIAWFPLLRKEQSLGKGARLPSKLRQNPQPKGIFERKFAVLHCRGPQAGGITAYNPRRSALKCLQHKPALCETTKNTFVRAKTPQGFLAPRDRSLT